MKGQDFGRSGGDEEWDGRGKSPPREKGGKPPVAKGENAALVWNLSVQGTTTTRTKCGAAQKQKNCRGQYRKRTKEYGSRVTACNPPYAATDKAHLGREGERKGERGKALNLGNTPPQLCKTSGDQIGGKKKTTIRKRKR